MVWVGLDVVLVPDLVAWQVGDTWVSRGYWALGVGWSEGWGDRAVLELIWACEGIGCDGCYVYWLWTRGKWVFLNNLGNIFGICAGASYVCIV